MLGRRADVDVSGVELVVVDEETRRAALATHLLALRGASLARIVWLAVRDVGKGYLLGRLRHAEKDLLGAWRFGCVAVALHKAHQKIPVTVHGSDVMLIWARVWLAGQVVPLGEQVLQGLLRSSRRGRRTRQADGTWGENVVDRVLRAAHTRIVAPVIVAVLLKWLW